MMHFTSRSFELAIKKAICHRVREKLIPLVSAGYRGFQFDGKGGEIADLGVIGLGPAGLFSCLRAVENGMQNVVAVDRLPTMGGTCINAGCVPSKTLINFANNYHKVKSGFYTSQGIETSCVNLDLERMMCMKSRVMKDLSKFMEELFKSLGIKIVRGTARFTGCKQLTVQGKDGLTKIVEAENIIIATGSVEKPTAIEVDQRKIVTSSGAMTLKRVPERLIVLGTDIIAIELGFMWSRLGSQVTFVTQDSFLCSRLIDKDIRQKYQKYLEEQGMKFLLKTKILCVHKYDEGVRVEIEDNREENKQELVADVVLVTPGRMPFTAGLNLDRVGIETNKSGAIPVHHNFQTCTPNIFAVGDVAPGPMSAHKAIEEGMLCVDGLCGLPTYLDMNFSPLAIYTLPGLASIGKTEEQLQKECAAYKVRWSSMEGNAQARIDGDTRGCVKALISSTTDHILGTHIIAANAVEMINEVVLAMHYGITAEKVARIMHTHPTYTKILKAVYGR